MPAPCNPIELFADAQLPENAAESFRDHLSSCRRCQIHLGNLLVLERLGMRYLTNQPQRRAAARAHLASDDE
jgi:cellulose synthase operon protein C